ncbi:hypothetical protein [Pedobacter sp. SYSU D00535]|uniref:hypothetical protein n=1 Tax=Pedobacter sp. SYSU D00535 TaxID=2810308 RepID=UPI001A97CBB2|nr:hypothetical protein [Pedobacter sp. SYSU D00535]
MKVLITGATSALAFQLEKKLGPAFDIVFADSQELPQFLLSNNRFLKIPKGSEPSFAHQLLSTCLDLEISYLFPLRREEILSLIEARQLFDEYGIKLMVPPQRALNSLLMGPKIGELTIVGLEEAPGVDESDTDRGAFWANGEDKATYRILTVD